MDFLKSILNWLIGVEETEGRKLVYDFAYKPESWMLFVFIALVALLFFAIFWVYRREMASCPRWVRYSCAVLRAGTLAFLVLLFLQPSVSTMTTVQRKPNIVIARDTSQSLDRIDKYKNDKVVKDLAEALKVDPDDLKDGKLKRSEIVNQLLFGDKQELLETLREKGSIRVIDFDKDVKMVGTLPATKAKKGTEEKETEEESNQKKIDKASPVVALGTSTNIWRVLKDSLRVNQLAAILLISDGQHTTPDDPVEIAKKAKEMGIPIYVIGMGDPNKAKNILITDVYVGGTAQPNEPFEIRCDLHTENVTQSEITVELIQESVSEADGSTTDRKTIKSKQVPVAPEGGRIQVSFYATVSTPGKYVYTVNVPPVDDESEIKDNVEKTSVVQALDEKVRVLLIAGAPTWEYQMVQRLYNRDPSIVLSCWLQTMDSSRTGEGNIPISKLPRTLKELSEYNVIMMFDPNPDELDEEWLLSLEKFAETKAGGLFYKAGPKYTDLFLALRQNETLRKLLPVIFSDSAEADVSRFLVSSNTTSSPLQIVLPNLEHPVMALHKDYSDKLKRWRQMPGVYWSYPAIKSKPTSRVLIEHSDVTVAADGQDARPLLVAGRSGRGNTLYLGFNGTWRWRRIGRQARYFDAFWIQVVRFLIQTRELQGLRRGVVQPDKFEYELGDRMTFSGEFQNVEFNPLMLPTVNASIDLGNGQKQSILFKLKKGSQGEYECVVPAQRVGDFKLDVELPGPNDDEAIKTLSFRVVPPRVESKAIWLNEPLLKNIASASGGKYFDLTTINELPDLLKTEVKSMQWQDRPKALWEVDKTSRLRVLCFCIPFILLTVEWSLRKGFKLL